MSKYNDRCECSDPNCPMHNNLMGELGADCSNAAGVLLFRCDMEDYTGTLFCNACADDARESGLFYSGRENYSRPIRKG